MIVGEGTMFGELGQTHPIPGGRVPGRQDIFCADGREGMDCQGDYELFGLGQTMPTNRHRLPGNQNIYCPSGRQGMACEESGELFGFGTMRVSDEAALGTMRVDDSAEMGEESEFFGGPAESLLIAALGLGATALNGLQAWYLFKTAPKEKGFWKGVGYTFGVLAALGTVGALVYTVGGAYLGAKLAPLSVGVNPANVANLVTGTPPAAAK